MREGDQHCRHWLDRDGDVGEGLGTEGVRDLLPHQAGVQQLPLPVGQIVLEVHVTGPVGHIDLHNIVIKYRI